MSDVLSILVVLLSLDFPSPPTDTVTLPLEDYTHCPWPPIGPLVESSSMPLSSPASVSQPSDDLPIAIRKSTLSTFNRLLVYNLLSFHCLSLPYFIFVSTLSSISTPNIISKALSHLGWRHAMVEVMDALYPNGT